MSPAATTARSVAGIHGRARRAGTPSTGHVGNIRGIAIDPRESWIASAGHDNTVRIWDYTTGKELHALTGHSDLALDVAINHDGSLLASACADGKVIVRRAADFEQTQVLTFDQPVRALDFHPTDPNTLAIGLEDGRVAIKNLAEPDQDRLLLGHTERVFDVAFSPDGKAVASAGRDQSILVHNLSTGVLLDTLVGHSGDVRGIAYSPDGRLISGSRDQTVMIWNPDRPQRLAQLPLGPESSVGVAFNPNGGQLLSITGVAELRAMDLNSGLTTVKSLSATPTILSYSTDGSIIGVGNKDGSLTLLDAGQLRNLIADPPSSCSPIPSWSSAHRSCPAPR